MNMKNILDFFFKKAAMRINERVTDSGLTFKKIHYNDPKMISRISNYKITKNNPYLIPDSAISTSYKDDTNNKMIPCGLLETKRLCFQSISEILWGTKTEILSYLQDLFELLWSELANNYSEYKIDNESYLCDYIPYAKYSTYWKLLFSSENHYPALYYGIMEDTVISNIDSSRNDALQFLYRKCQYEFQSIFLKFSKETTSFHKIDMVFQEKFIAKQFIPMLKRYAPGSDSLGLRVRDLINADLSYCASILTSTHIDDLEYQKSLINASSEYILALEKIQKVFANTKKTR